MFRVFLIAMGIFLTVQSGVSQSLQKAYLYAEYGRPRGGNCDEFFRIVDFHEELKKQPESKGLIIVYSGDNSRRMGNVFAYVSNAEKYMRDSIGLPPGRIAFVVAEGRNLFNEEFWIVPEKASLPDFKRTNFSFNGITENKYLFSTTCLQCEPSYPLLTDFQPNFEEYAKVLISNPQYKGLITVTDSDEAKRVRQAMAEQKVAKPRFSVQILKNQKENNLETSLYIISTSNLNNR